MASSIQIKRVISADAETLLHLSRKTFFDAFAHLNNAADMEAYASTAFTLQKYEEELSNPDSHFYFAVADNDIAGYIKLNYNAAQTELQDPTPLR
jgi:hypothetical protein